MILAIDTSAGQCAVSVAEVARVEAMTRGHAERLFPMIGDALAAAGAGWADIARIAVCTGPGSFTGIRVGVAAARGLALARGVPAIGITRFEALAFAAIRARRFIWMPGDIRVPGEDRSDAAESPRGIAVAIAARGGCYRQDFPVDWPGCGQPGAMHFESEEAGPTPPPRALLAGDGWAGGTVVKGPVDPLHLAHLAEGRAPGAPPAPCYLRAADAAPRREAPPAILDS